MPCQRKLKYGKVKGTKMVNLEKCKSGEILSAFLGRFPDKGVCTQLENDFVSDTKRKHNYSKAAQKIPSAFGLRENYAKVPSQV